MAAGAVFLHEKIAAAPPDLAAEALALAVAIGGIIALAQRAPQATEAGPSFLRDHRGSVNLSTVFRTSANIR
jgi:hypothetical protein